MKGTVYKIIAHPYDDTDQFLTYIGSTKLKVEERISRHLRNMRYYNKDSTKCDYCHSFKLLCKPWYEYHVLETGEYENVKELHKAETKWIDHYRNDNDYRVVNGPNAYSGDRLEQKRKSYHKHREHNLEVKAKWRATHKEHTKQKDKQYRELKKEYRAEKIQCECGKYSRRDHISVHRKTNKHMNAMELKQQTEQTELTE
jgi:hypothetical protein